MLSSGFKTRSESLRTSFARASRRTGLNPVGDEVSLDHVTRSLIVLTSTSLPSCSITVPVPVGVVALAVNIVPTETAMVVVLMFCQFA